MKLSRWLSFILFAALMAACRPSSASPTATSSEPDAVKTSAAVTAQALLTERASLPTDTPAPTATSPESTPTPEETAATGVTATPGAAATEGGVAPPPSGGADSAEFVADVTVPDGTQYSPGDAFEKTWQLRNNGTSTWTTDYNLIFVSGAQMSGPALQPLTANVPPGETANLTVALVAPAEPGTQRGFWMLQNAQGQNFGVGPEADLAFYVEISVLGDGGSPVPTVPPAGGSGVIESLGINVDQGSYTGLCPHTFSFSVNVTASEPVLVTLQLVAGSDNPGYIFDLPAPQSYNLDTGTSSFLYTLNLTDNVSGWARAQVTSPVIVDSNTVNFSLTCE